ncbi:cytochrome c [Hymenobacter sp. 5516J-16]|uniref:c-type cytochrome n=1 Tax=Hymenobacter sp. 5516J-16 TaxID=2932253 RepID=UPI001FD35CD2|nr:cytochrome c [Hymenobacter sp. 5516J-16]UOQ78709.1 cytochrome c [Hymenobacter sp. 5516J-16]
MAAFPFLLRLHQLVVLAFLLFYAFKAGLLVLGRLDTLRTVRARTRLADSGLGLLILASGGASLALYPGGAPGWLWVKLGLVLVLLPLAIMAMRRQFKPGVVLTFLGFLYVYGVSETGSPTLQQAEASSASNGAAAYAPGRAEATATPEAVAPVDTARAAASLSAAEAATLAAAAEAPAADEALVAGKALFVQQCAVCHGPDGKLGLNGAYDLTKSNLTQQGRIYQVTHGSISKKMPAFGGKLTQQQIEQVVAYSLTLKKL